MIRRTYVLAACLGASMADFSAGAGLVDHLRCEYSDNPMSIDIQNPRLSWVLESTRRGEMQTAYQVLVASSETLLAKDQGDLWDSGKVASDESIQVEYAGKLLPSRQSCWWKARVWNADGQPSA